MNILEEFWHGNIEPSEYDTSPDPEYKEILSQISRNEDKLLATMAVGKKNFSPGMRIVSGSISPWPSACSFRMASASAPG